MDTPNRSSPDRLHALLGAASTGAVGALAALGLWELTEVPGFLAAAAGSAAGVAVHVAGTLTDRSWDRPGGVAGGSGDT